MTTSIRSLFHLSAINCSHGENTSCPANILVFNAAYGTKQGTIKHTFWSASPSGKAEVTLPPDCFVNPVSFMGVCSSEFRGGTYFYFDFTSDPDEEVVFRVDRLSESYSLTPDGNGQVLTQQSISLTTVSPSWGHGSMRFEITVTNSDVFGFFNKDSLYSLRITRADV